MLWLRLIALGAVASGALGANGPAQTTPAAAVVGATTAKPSIADFATPPSLRSPMMSPDGRWLAARAGTGKDQRILIINVDDPAGRPRALQTGDVLFRSLYWAGNNRLLMTVIKQTRIGALFFPYTRLLIVDLTTGQIKVGDPKSDGLFVGEVLFVDPDGQYALVASQKDIYSNPQVKRVDLGTGAAVVVEKERPNVWDWFVDTNGTVRAGLAYDDRSWKLFYRDKPEESLRIVKGHFDKDDDSRIERFTFGPSGKGTIITNERTGRFGVYHYDFATGAIGAPIFEHPNVDVGEVYADQWSGDVGGVSYEDDRTRFQWFDADMRKVQSSIDRALPDKVNEVVSFSRDKNRVLVRSSAATDPGAYYVLDRRQLRMSPVANPYDRIDPAAMSNVKSVSFKTRDGLEIPAYLTLPRTAEKGPPPLIMLPHGGPFARDDWQYDPLVQFLASRGYAVFQPQFRGSTGFGRAFAERGYGQWGRAMQDDLDDGLDWLVKSGQVDPKRVCIMGLSYGGYAALWGAIRNPERYRCAVSYAGVTDLEAQLRDNRESFSATRYFREWRTRVAGPQKIDLGTVSPLQQVAHLNTPVLIAHGESDGTVSSKQSHALVTALEHRHAPVTSVFYKDHGHDLGNEADETDFFGRLETFLAKYNPA
ncbi:MULTISPECIES: S9 family peptidase [Sphingomonas]|uniref:S9 family peptidase n=1 Tax=Sphingomonas TaxID=13687 RepID=UPI000DEF5FA4|nr:MULTISPECIES: alpha/beta fold hydrolase [Sphingomonas]